VLPIHAEEFGFLTRQPTRQQNQLPPDAYVLSGLFRSEAASPAHFDKLILPGVQCFYGRANFVLHLVSLGRLPLLGLRQPRLRAGMPAAASDFLTAETVQFNSSATAR
jgi:hypothetical protein